MFLFFNGLIVLVCVGLLYQFPRSHSEALHSVVFLWTSDHPDAEKFYMTTHNTHNRETSISTAEFELAVPTSERPQTHALDCVATGIGAV